jgi:hypothetical protein
VGNTVIGYKRRCTVPATKTEPAKGPFYDEIDEETAPVIREVFERIANGETAAEVGDWLDPITFAKAKWSRRAKWTVSINGVRDAVLQRTLVVNAFDEPQLVKHARVIVQQRLAGKTYKEIAKDLDLTEYHMENCATIVKLMEAAGLAEPYRRLTEKSDHVPQCCSKHWLKAGDRKGGGKRRRAS